METKPVVVDTTLSPHARLKPVPITNVKLKDTFWAPRIELLSTSTLPAIYSKLEESGALNNFRRILGRVQAEFKGYVFADEHVYKWLEATAWLLSYKRNRELEEKVKEVVELVEAVQEPDGYINTRFHGKPEERYKNLRWSHELYVGGHMIQAAIACKRTGVCEKLFNVAIKYAEHLYNTFGPGKLEMPDGHPEIEIALPELYRETRDKRLLELTEFFIELRGRGKLDGWPYFVDNKPFKQLDEAPPGAHAVRFLYLTTGATDLYLETGNKELWEAIDRLWLDVVNKKMYITGGVGSRHDGEAIGEAYELPNDRAYAETCASVANVMWNYRLLLATGEAKYADIMELTLYNGALSGISLDGKLFFYVNPLADRGKHRRQPWFPCPCCPPNIARLLASLPGYFYNTSSDGIWINLYASNEADIEFKGKKVKIEQETNYPWDGRVLIKVYPETEDEFSIYLRIPGWAQGAKVYVNDKPVNTQIKPSTYLRIERLWRMGDTIRLDIEMPIKLIASNPMVIHNTGKVAIKRGPIIYCLEQVDNPGIDVWSIALTTKSKLEARFEPNLLNGVVVIEGEGYALEYSTHELYIELNKFSLKTRKAKFKAIPYYAWANREPGPMTVWIPLLDMFEKKVIYE
ncbi:MAG: glycoside hydrolase family 127 protein [Desulfurococcaceae archaeon]